MDLKKNIQTVKKRLFQMRDFAEAVGSHTNLWKSKSMEEKRDCRMAQRPQKKLDALEGKREISTFGRAY